MGFNRNMLRLQPFSTNDAATTVTWPQSSTEARWWAGPQTSWPIAPDVFQRWHADPDVHAFILSDGTTPIGYGELWIDAIEQETELARLMVAPAYRKQGIGVALVQLLLGEAAKTGYPRTFMRVFPDNQIAINCYLRAGFTALDQNEQELFNRGQPMNYLWMGRSATD